MLLKAIRLQNIPQVYHLVFFIGYLDAHRRFSWYGRFNSDISGRQAQFDVICQAYNLTDLYPLLRMKLIPGYGRSAAYIGDRNPDTEILKSPLELNGSFLVFPVGKDP